VLPADVGRVVADPSQIEQVILNLAVNARDAMPTGGKLTIESGNAEFDAAYARAHAPAVPGRFVMLAVSDSGAGMSPEVQARVFEPFFTTKAPGKGTGLGLATVYGIVKQSGGFIWVYSEPGQGTTFKIYLPRASDDQRPAALSVAQRDVRGGDEVVLLVEDEAPVRRVALHALQRYGYTVLEAALPSEALTICRDHAGRIDLVVTDVVMPGMSGPDLVQQLLVMRPGLKVLLSSGYPGEAIACPNRSRRWDSRGRFARCSMHRLLRRNAPRWVKLASPPGGSSWRVSAGRACRWMPTSGSAVAPGTRSWARRASTSSSR